MTDTKREGFQLTQKHVDDAHSLGFQRGMFYAAQLLKDLPDGLHPSDAARIIRQRAEDQKK